MGSVLSARTGTVSRPARLGPAKRDGPHVGRVCNLPAEDLTTDLSRSADMFVIDILDARSVTVFSYNNFRFSRPMARAGSDARGRGSFGSRSDRKVPEAGWASGTCLNLSHQR